MQAQRDEQDAKCERVPQTTEQQKTDCLNEGGQWDYSGNVCQQKTMEISVEQMESYSLADVEMHATQDSCRAAIDGKVYDLTNWVNKHPGGADKIVAICGTDATEAFANQHDAQEKPENQLMQFAI